MSEELLTIGKKIRQAREAKNITRKELTGKSQLTASYLANLETDQIQAPSLPRLQRIATALEMDWQELIKDTGSENLILRRQEKASIVWCRNYVCPAVKRLYADQDGGGYYFPDDLPYLHEYTNKDGTPVRVISYPSYPAYNEQGEQNRYCPACGRELVGNCEDCGRIIDGHHSYCTGCGGSPWPIKWVTDVPEPTTGGISEDDVPF